MVDFAAAKLYALKAYKGAIMVRHAIESNSRIALRIAPREKATLMRAVELEKTDMTDFILRTALREARAVIEKSEKLQLSGRDTLRVMELLEHPPAPNARLRRAARNLPR